MGSTAGYLMLPIALGLVRRDALEIAVEVEVSPFARECFVTAHRRVADHWNQVTEPVPSGAEQLLILLVVGFIRPRRPSEQGPKLCVGERLFAWLLLGEGAVLQPRAGGGGGPLLLDGSREDPTDRRAVGCGPCPYALARQLL
jgi:hypothetical protein